MDPGESPLLTSERDGHGIVRLVLNRPQRRNALSAALVEALQLRLDRLAEDPAVRVLVLSGAGEAFCGGADIGEMKASGSAPPAENQANAQRFAALLERLEHMPQPTLACVQGAAYGGALGLVAACDIAIAAAGARFALSEVRLGLIPAMISPYLVRAIGARQASRWFLSGEPMDAATALRIGLVHEVAADGDLEALQQRIIAALLAGGPVAQAECKRLIRHATGRNENADHESRAATAAWIARLRAGDEGREGLAAYLEKRPPAWTTKR